MLQAIREKTSGWIAYLIIGLISIPFALWGINSYLGGGEQQPAAIVNGEEISVQQLDFAYSRYRQRLLSVFGGQMPAAFADDEVLKEQVLSQVIEEQVLLSYIQDRGFRVNDEKLFELIQATPAFQIDGQFSAEQYRNQLASQGYLPAQFEEEIRRSEEMRQLGSAITATAFVVPVQLDRYQALNNQERKIRTLIIAAESDVEIEISDAAIEEYYESQSAFFMQPARARVEYIELSLQSIIPTVEVTEERVRERYEQLRESLTTPEYRSARHILLTLAADADDATQQQVKEEIDKLKARIDAGEDFAMLAREFSQDPGSAADGGDLGEVERGMMVKPFERVLFSLQPGQVSDPVKTQFGWHLIELLEIVGGETPSFAEARDQIEQDLRTEQAENQIYDLAENLANISYEQPDSLLPASEQLGLEIQTSDWFTRSKGEGIAENNLVRQAAFSDDVLQQNRNSDAIELGDNRMVVLHLKEYEAAQLQPLEEVRSRIIDELTVRKLREINQERGQQVLQDLRQGQDLDTAASSLGLTVSDLDYVDRNNAEGERDIINLAFTMAKPETGAVTVEGVALADGSYAIVELTDVRMASAEESAEDNQIAQTLSTRSGDGQYQALIQSLTAEADVVRTPVSELQ